MTHISSEGRHVAGGIGEFQHRAADDLAGRLGAEGDGLIASGRDEGELLDNEPVQVLALNLLARDIIERNGVEIRAQACGTNGRLSVCRNNGERISYPRTGDQRRNHGPHICRSGHVFECKQIWDGRK